MPDAGLRRVACVRCGHSFDDHHYPTGQRTAVGCLHVIANQGNARTFCQCSSWVGSLGTEVVPFVDDTAGQMFTRAETQALQLLELQNNNRIQRDLVRQAFDYATPSPMLVPKELSPDIEAIVAARVKEELEKRVTRTPVMDVTEDGRRFKEADQTV